MNKPFKITILAFALIILSMRCEAQTRQLFDGGMMVHTGYMHGTFDEIAYEAKGMNFGLGGVLRFHISNHFRIGGEGYVSTLKQLKNGSYIRTGCGGLLADAYWKFGRWIPYLGVTVGGGKASTVLMFDGSPDDWEAEPEVFLHSDPFFFITPNVGVEFAITDAVHLTLRVDRLFPVSKTEMPSGVRFYLGFVFAH